MKKTIFLLLLLLIVPLSFSQSQKINSFVVDNAGILTPESKSVLESRLRQIEKSTNGVQFIVYIDKEYPKEYSLEQYSLMIAEQNGIGTEENDNGLLFYLAVNDRQFRWETGYGMESTLNAALLGRISRDYMVPEFKNNNYELGILKAVDVVEKILLNSQDADIVALKNESKPSISPTAIIWIIFIVLMLIRVILAARMSKKGINGMQIQMLLAMRRRKKERFP